MIAKEKAKHLVDKYKNLLMPIEKFQDNLIHHRAKQCALIALEEIFGVIGITPETSEIDNAGIASVVYPYWADVYNEINKL